MPKWVRANVNVYWHAIFTWLKPYFNIRALIFYMCEGSSQPIANSIFITKHAKNYGINNIDYEGHNIWHTR